MKAIVLTVLIAILSFVSFTHAAGCKYTELTDGKVIDVSGIDASSGNYETDCRGGWNCYVNVCAKAKAPSSEKCSIPAHGYQYSSQWGDCNPLGDTNAANIALLDPSNEKGGVIISYGGVAGSDNTKRGIEFSITCDENAETFNPTFTGESKGDTIVYRFTGSSKHACPVIGGGGSDDLPLGQYGVGGLLLTLALVALMLYFIIGAVLMKFKFQKAGIEIIPNVGFWKDIPFLLKDGAMLPVDLIKGASGRGAYQTMA
ncbi:hypothetical protein ABK040_000746 [Willaertia magna]